MLAAHNLDWSRTDILLSDERWVSPDHSASNARLIREYFLERGAAEAVFHPLWVNTHSPSDGLTDVAKKLRKLSRPFDVAYLGMGPDGHIASLFPSVDSSEFDCATSCVLASKAPNDPRQRISMTLSCLLETRSVFLHVTGVEKRLILERASKNAPTAGCPVSLLLHQYPGDLMVFAA